MNKLDQIIESSTHECMGIPQLDPHQLAQQVVGETILAILATDTRPLVYTSFDKDMAAGIIARVVDQVRNHWSFK